MSLKVSDIGEKELIKYILSNCKDITFDDGAISQLNDSELVSTCDMLIQSHHFPPEMSYFQMGFKAVTVNVSDLAAMGAKPLGFLIAMGLPKDLEVKNFKEIVNGILEACKFYEIPLIGGDTNESSEVILSGTALGLNSKNSSVRRDSYNKGDLLCITGSLGLASLGFTMLDRDNKYSQKVFKPIARIKEGLKLKEINATSATDITDGLASELYEIKKDEYGFMIYEEKLGTSISLDHQLYFGEDFELLFTIAERDLDKIPFEYIVIGEVNNSDKVEITKTDGEVEIIKNKGYNHYVL